jgi:deazaflavin-dependent oxidoreductase (nitroreductase family)
MTAAIESNLRREARTQSRKRPLLGVRRRPGRLVLVLFRMPLRAYRHGRGSLLGHTFLLLGHVGRTTGRRYDTVAMVLSYRADVREAVICSAWGPNADWVRNLRARPALQVQIGSDSFVPEHRFMDEDEAIDVARAFRRRHPWRLRLVSTILGWGDLRSDAALRRFVSRHPFVALRPARSAS